MAGFVPGHITVNNYTTLESKVDSLFADSSLEFVIDGGGAEITTGVKGYLMMPYNGRVSHVALLADQVGDIKIDIWRIGIEQINIGFPPTDADSITNGKEPEISGDDHWRIGSTGWGQGNYMNVYDILAINVDSCTTIQRVTLVISIAKSVGATRTD